MEKLALDVKKYADAYKYERAERLGVSYKKNSQASEGGSRKALYLLPGSQEI